MLWDLPKCFLSPSVRSFPLAHLYAPIHPCECHPEEKIAYILANLENASNLMKTF